MTAYRAPLRDMQFVLRELAGLDAVAQLPGYGDTPEALDAILEEASDFAGRVLDPLNASGDKAGCQWKDGVVTTPPGFTAAYRQFAQAGWIGLTVPAEYDGQALPQLLLGPTLEMWNAANIGFANGPLLNQGAIEAIELCGSQEQKRQYIPQLVSGRWMGTMCLTEPQAGSDLAQVRTKAVPDGDVYRITGQKIFITFGEHDMAENIVHLVLARLPDAPLGTKGISLFIVPKFLANTDGTLGKRNDVSCSGIEHKLGLNANPTCTLNYGEEGVGAAGYLVGEAHRGLAYMFVMMNSARFSVGVQAIGLADRAYQHALEYARERVQSRDAAAPDGRPVAIVEHPDVRRMLLFCKAQIEAMRALAYVTGAALDFSNKAPDLRVRDANKAFVELMIPVLKGWCTETAVEICSTALQVFGGTGYVEETGIAQQYRDVRVTTIYEGTTGIQALDLVGRKLLRDKGAVAFELIERIGAFASELERGEDPALIGVGRRLAAGVATLARASRRLEDLAADSLHEAFAGSVPYLKLWGIVAGGWQMARAAKIAREKLAANDATSDFYRAKLDTVQFYCAHVLSQCTWLAAQIEATAEVTAPSVALFDLDRRSAARV